MRRWSVTAGLLLAMSLGADAAAPGASPEDPAALVGTYTGTWRWTGCAVPGAARASARLAYVDGAWAGDFAAVHPGIGAPTLQASATTLEAQVAGATLVLRPSTTGLDATITFTSGCAGHAALLRATVGVPACDRAIALLAIHAACPRAQATPMPPMPKTIGRDAAARQRAATSCRAIATPLAQALIDDGCVPVPAAQRPITIPACTALDAMVGAINQCSAMPPSVRASVAGQASATAGQVVPADTSVGAIAIVARQCDATAALVRAAMAQARC